MLLAWFSACKVIAEPPQERSVVIGAWKDTFEGNSIAVFCLMAQFNLHSSSRSKEMTDICWGNRRNSSQG